MATYNNVVYSKSATLAAATADTVNFTLRPPYLFVTNTGSGASSTIYVRTDGTTPSSTGSNDGDIAVVAGATVCVPTGKPFEPLPNLDATAYTAQNNPAAVTAVAAIQLISAGTPSYTVAR